MKLTDRDRWIALLLPAVLVVGCYAWWFRVSMSPALAKLDQDYRTAVSGQLSPSAVAEQRAKALAPRQEIDQLRGKRETLEAQAAELCGQWANPTRQLEVNRQLMALFARNELSLVKEAPLQGEAAAKLPKSLSAALESVGWTGRGGVSQVRAFTLTGRFPQMLRAIEELAEHQPCLAIPIGLSMAEVDTSMEDRQWTLVVWM